MSFSLAGECTGAAWLSSARVVRCWVKSRNERNPRPLLLTGNAENSEETAGDKPEEVGMTSSPHGPYTLGYTRVTMVVTMSRDPARASQSQKATSVWIVLCNTST